MTQKGFAAAVVAFALALVFASACDQCRAVEGVYAVTFAPESVRCRDFDLFAQSVRSHPLPRERPATTCGTTVDTVVSTRATNGCVVQRDWYETQDEVGAVGWLHLLEICAGEVECDEAHRVFYTKLPK